MAYETQSVLVPVLCFLFSAIIMVSLHRKTLARILGLFARRHSSYFRLNDPTAAGTKEGATTGDSIPRESREIEGMGERIVEFESVFSCESLGSDIGSDFGEQEEEEEEFQCLEDEDGDDTQSETSVLSKYFDPYTSILRDGVLEPSSPPRRAWERRMDLRIRNGRGLSAWIDWAVDRSVGWFQRVMEAR